MKSIILITLSMFLISCITTAPIVNPTSVIRLYGVSVLPPHDGKWAVITASGHQAAIGRQGQKRGESLIANLNIYKLPELATDTAFLEHIAKGRAAEPDIGRFDVSKR